MSVTPSGHIDYRLTTQLFFYGPTIPALEERLFPSRDPQTLDRTLRSLPVVVLRLLYFFSVALPVHLFLTLCSYALWSRKRWIEKGYGSSHFPLRHPNWTLRRALVMPLVYTWLWCQYYALPAHRTFERESAPTKTKVNQLGIGYQGWKIECEAVTIPPLPLPGSNRSDAGTRPTSSSSPSSPPPGSRPRAKRVPTREALEYSEEDDGVPDTLLRGDVAGQRFGVSPTAVPAFWLWKTHAAEVKAGEVVAVKPGSPLAGIGCGPANGPSERVILYLCGGGYVEGHPLLYSLPASVCRTTSLRVFCVNYRKATTASNAFPAALQDALAGWVYLTKRLRFAPHNVILLGESAGGNLCTALQLYLSALMFGDRGGKTDLGRASRIVLHSSWCDLTASGSKMWENRGFDVLPPAFLCNARDAFLRHVIPVKGRWNPIFDSDGARGWLTCDEMGGEKKSEKHCGLAALSQLSARYDVDAHAVGSEGYFAELRQLALDLPSTLTEAGAFHPLFSPGYPVEQNDYLRKALMLLGPPPPLRGQQATTNRDDQDESRKEDGDDVRLPSVAVGGQDRIDWLLTVGSIELFQDQVTTFVHNLNSLSIPPSVKAAKIAAVTQAPLSAAPIGANIAPLRNVGVKLVEGVGEYHAYAIVRWQDKVKDEIDELVRAFIVA